MATTLSLVADIGGTNTRVALADGPAIRHDSIRRYRNAGEPDLETVLRSYLADAGDPAPDAACIAVAGPVRGGVATLTNLDWTMDLETVGAATGAGEVSILNDLQAQGYALAHLGADTLHVIVEGAAAEPQASRLVIGIGTGFNAAPVHASRRENVVPASECGHQSLPVRTDADLALARHVEAEHGFPSIEDVLSGRGLEHIAGFLGATGRTTSADIMAGLKAGDDARAAEAGRIFARHLGVVASDLALVHLPFGGIYLCGGLARAFARYLGDLGLVAAFRDKGRFSEFMAAFSISVIEDDYAALTGCAAHLDAILAA